MDSFETYWEREMKDIDFPNEQIELICKETAGQAWDAAIAVVLEIIAKEPA